MLYIYNLKKVSSAKVVYFDEMYKERSRFIHTLGKGSHCKDNVLYELP